MHDLPFSGLRRARLGRWVVWLAAAAAASGAWVRAAAADADGGPAAVPIAFDIAYQPLGAALDQYYRLTGLSLLYDDTIVQGKFAGPLRGTYRPGEGLRRLLAGSGIAARYTSASALMLMPDPAQADAEAAQAAGRQRYFARVQAAVTARLCADPFTAPGGYRLALNLWLDAGRVVRVQVAATGDAARDARVQRQLAELPVGAMPEGLRQPVTLLLQPRPARAEACPQRVGLAGLEAQ